MSPRARSSYGHSTEQFRVNRQFAFSGLLAGILAMTDIASAFTGSFRLTTIGNSITWHGPNSTLKWNGQWGMAASHAGADYSARLALRLEKETGRSVVLQRFNHSKLEQAEAYLPPPVKAIETARLSDAVVVELGDNAPKDSASIPGFIARYSSLLRAVKPVKGTLFCTGTWWQREDLNRAMRHACIDEGGRFVDLSSLWNRPELKASATVKEGHPGVLDHPGDDGMTAISESIFVEMSRSGIFP